MKNKNNDSIVNSKDKSPIVFQRDKIKNTVSVRPIHLNEKQKQFMDLATNKSAKIIFVEGPAGTAKTFMAIYAALHFLNNRSLSDIIYIRSAVESADSKLGFLPGEADEKMAPYIQPLMDKLNELLYKNDVDYLLKDKRITGIPIGFLRGLNWNAKVIIADEAQNMTKKELFTLITRTGEFSKVFLLGDTDQSDINGKSGFKSMITIFDDEESRQNGIYVFRLSEDDIVRSQLLKFIVKKVKKTL